MGNVSRWYAKAQVERCESGRIGLTANELTWETGSEGSNPSLSAGKTGWLGRHVTLSRCTLWPALEGSSALAVIVRIGATMGWPSWIVRGQANDVVDVLGRRGRSDASCWTDKCPISDGVRGD